MAVGPRPRSRRQILFLILLLVLLLLLLLLLQLELLLLAQNVGEVGQLDGRGLVEHRRRSRVAIHILLHGLDEIDAADVRALEDHLGVLLAQWHAITEGPHDGDLLGGDLLDQALKDAQDLVAGYRHRTADPVLIRRTHVTSFRYSLCGCGSDTALDWLVCSSLANIFVFLESKCLLALAAPLVVVFLPNTQFRTNYAPRTSLPLLPAAAQPLISSVLVAKCLLFFGFLALWSEVLEFCLFKSLNAPAIATLLG